MKQNFRKTVNKVVRKHYIKYSLPKKVRQDLRTFFRMLVKRITNNFNKHNQ